ncbi:hypothetical protein MLD38_004907 [Melastoma candidum]|uniref:Uncharacterized protein n=1 Tax=Melastoma candidum TaxID=119954 RepID=A0ACB9S6W7_9MYRT|nr:hypothetical protein MLD38_004907 [Melastoma candidum]
MDSHPDQEVAEALEPDGCPNQDSGPRESFVLDSENLKVIQNDRERPDLVGKCDKEGASQGGRDFNARCSPKNKDIQHEVGVQGRDLAVACSGVWPVLKQETAVLDSLEESVVQLDKFPVPYLLRRVLLPEWAEINGDDYRLLAVVVQAVMLGSGFLRIDPTTRLPLHNAPVSSSWPKEPATAMSLQYSLPEILAARNDKTFQGVAVKLQKLGRFVIVYGSLTPAKSELRRVHLDVTAFWPKLRLLMNFLNGNSITSASSMQATCRYPERVAFTLWNLLRDGLVRPLLIDLSDVAGSRAPSSFSDMPEKIKLNILKRLKGADLARAGSVSMKLRQLSSNRNLWEKAYRDDLLRCR